MRAITRKMMKITMKMKNKTLRDVGGSGRDPGEAEYACDD